MAANPSKRPWVRNNPPDPTVARTLRAATPGARGSSPLERICTASITESDSSSALPARARPGLRPRLARAPRQPLHTRTGAAGSSASAEVRPWSPRPPRRLPQLSPPSSPPPPPSRLRLPSCPPPPASPGGTPRHESRRRRPLCRSAGGPSKRVMSGPVTWSCLLARPRTTGDGAGSDSPVSPMSKAKMSPSAAMARGGDGFLSPF